MANVQIYASSTGPVVHGWRGSSASITFGPGDLIGMAGTNFSTAQGANLMPDYDLSLWVHGHILNRHLGGNGIAQNLVPLTNKANGEHKTWESYVKHNLLTVINGINRPEIGSNKYQYVDITRYVYCIYYAVDVSDLLLKPTYPGVPSNSGNRLPPMSILVEYDIKRYESATNTISNLNTDEYDYITRRYSQELTYGISGINRIYNTHF